MTPKTRLGAFAITGAAALLCLLPAASQGGKVDLGRLDDGLRHTTQQLTDTVDKSLEQTETALRRAEEALRRKAQAKAAANAAKLRATATDPVRQPPLHGSNPHGQGSVAVVDVTPSAERPLGGDPVGTDAGPEETVIGRARGEKTAAGAYHGHITILALLGSEIAGVDSAPGETKNGPLQPIQAGVLDPLCASSSGATCLSVLTANSTTTATGSTNEFAIATAKVAGIGVGAAQSGGTIGEDANCQASTGSSRTADVSTSNGSVAQVATASSTSKSCRGQAPQTLNSSTVVGLGGVGVPLPAAGCANGTPDTVSGLPPLLPVVCNADEIAGAAAVREALDVYVLTVGTGALAKETTAAAESFSVAPAAAAETTKPQCSDGADNDGDGVIDAADPGCHSDGNPNNPASYNPNDNDETNRPTGGSGDPDPDSGDDDGPSGGAGDPQCSDGRDNDGDGVSDEADPGCHSDGDPNNPASYDPNDDSEADGPRTVDASSLPFTGFDLTGLALAGLLLLAGGLLMRRRDGGRASL